MIPVRLSGMGREINQPWRNWNCIGRRWSLISSRNKRKPQLMGTSKPLRLIEGTVAKGLPRPWPASGTQGIVIRIKQRRRHISPGWLHFGPSVGKLCRRWLLASGLFRPIKSCWPRCRPWSGRPDQTGSGCKDGTGGCVNSPRTIHPCEHTEWRPAGIPATSRCCGTAARNVAYAHIQGSKRWAH